MSLSEIIYCITFTMVKQGDSACPVQGFAKYCILQVEAEERKKYIEHFYKRPVQHSQCKLVRYMITDNKYAKFDT